MKYQGWRNIQLNVKNITNEVLYNDYIMNDNDLNFVKAEHDGLYSDLNFLLLFKDKFLFWDDILINSTIPVKTLYKCFKKYLIKDPALKIAIENCYDYLESSDWGDSAIIRIKEFLNEYEKDRR